MKSILIVLMLSMPACALLMPSEQEFSAAQDIVMAHDAGGDVDPETLASAREIIQAYESPGIDWTTIGSTIAVTLLGMPLAAGRGRQLIAAGVRALLRGDYKGAARAGVSYTFASHSGKALSGSKSQKGVSRKKVS